ncbi:MAG: HEAT repeat domain-containing protein, partial [Promethearchaeota archaeon]
KQVVIDPDYATLMDWNIEKPEPMWINQLLNGSNSIQKIKAAKALGKKATSKIVETLGKALREEEFWGTQSEIAKVLGSLKSDGALEQLLKAVSLKNTKARTAVATALGQFYKSDIAFNALTEMLGDEESYFVVAAAATSIGKTQHDRAFDQLVDFLKKAPPSWHDLVQVGALQGLAETEREDVIEIAKDYLKVGTSDWIRRRIPSILARLGKRYKKDHPEIKSILERTFLDKSYRVRTFSIDAAPTLEDSALIPTLSKIAEREAESGIVRRCRISIRKLSKKKEPKEIDSLRKSIEELEKENRKLKDRLDKIESTLKLEDEE